MMMPNATAGMISMQLRLDRPRALHLHRVRGRRERDRRGRPADPRRQRRRRRGRRHRGLVTPVTVAAFARMGALSTPQRRSRARASRPFDADRDGFVIAEGAAFLVLESLERALARGRHASTARCAGYGRNADALPHHRAVARRRGRGRVHAARARRRRPRRRRRSVTSTRTARRPRSTTPPRPRRSARCSATTRTAGHVHQGRHRAHDRRRRRGRGRRSRCCRSRDGIVPPTANLERIGDDIGLDVVAGEPRPIGAAPVLSNSFGFGGHNATLILGSASTRRAGRERPDGARRPTPVVRAPQRRGRRRRVARDRRPHGQLVPPRRRQAPRRHRHRPRARRSSGPSRLGGRARRARGRAASRSSGADVVRGRRLAPRVGPGRHARSPSLGRRADRAPAGRRPVRVRARRCCSASPTT